jgi:hypothetical protein
MTRPLLIALTAGALLAGRSSTASRQSSPCPGQSSDFSIRVDISAVTPGTTLRLCTDTSSCVARRVTKSSHTHYIFVGYRYTGTASSADIRLTAQALRDGHARRSAVVLPIEQRQLARCGDYGGPGYAVANKNLTLSASHLLR